MKESYGAGERRTIQTIGRVYLVSLGAIAVLWGLQTLPTVWREAALDRTASQILGGQVYKMADLRDLGPLIETVERATLCRPSSLRSASVIRLRMIEEATRANDQSDLDKNLDDLISATRTALKCSPADSFLWFVLYWAESTRNNFDPHYLDHLRLSYKLGPYEGWIALKRNQVALKLFKQLPPDLAEMVLKEYVGLVSSGFYFESAEILTGPGWPVRELILPRLGAVPERHRVALEREVYRLGYDINVPGIDRGPDRPWRR